MTSGDADRAQRAGKERLRDSRRGLSLPEKVQQVVELQKIAIPLIRRRRKLNEWERVWPLEKP